MSPREELQALLDRISFGPPLAPFAPEVRVAAPPRRDGLAHLCIAMRFTEARTGEPFEVLEPVSVRDWRNPTVLAGVIFDGVVRRLRHEVGESIQLDGAVVFDPHHPSTRRPDPPVPPLLRPRVSESILRALPSGTVLDQAGSSADGAPRFVAVVDGEPYLELRWSSHHDRWVGFYL